MNFEINNSQMENLKLIIILSFFIVFGSCKNEKATVNDIQTETLNRKDIDKKAMELATASFEAMGGLDKYNDLNYISWTFFGARHLIWDKIGGRVRIDSPKDTSIYLIDLNQNAGRVIRGGVEITDPEELAKQVKRGKSIWINDSYWLVMPWKLFDEGVNLKYARQDSMIGGKMAEVLELTFDNVGNTPENKYEVYIDKDDHMIKQWAFFSKADQEDPPRIWPWDNYQSHNGLLFSSDRSDESGPSNVKVYTALADETFTSFDPLGHF